MKLKTIPNIEFILFRMWSFGYVLRKGMTLERHWTGIRKKIENPIA